MAGIRIAVAGIRVAIAGIRIAMAEVRIATAPVRIGMEVLRSAPGHIATDRQRAPITAGGVANGGGRSTVGAREGSLLRQ